MTIQDVNYCGRAFEGILSEEPEVFATIIRGLEARIALLDLRGEEGYKADKEASELLDFLQKEFS